MQRTIIWQADPPAKGREILHLMETPNEVKVESKVQGEDTDLHTS